VLEPSAQPCIADDVANLAIFAHFEFLQRLIAYALVRSIGVAIVEVLINEMINVLLATHKEVIEAFVLDGLIHRSIYAFRFGEPGMSSVRVSKR